MTRPPTYPPPRRYNSPSNPQYPPRAACGSVPMGAPQDRVAYGQALTPTGHGACMPPAQSAILTQLALRPSGTPSFSGQSYPPAPVQTFVPQYQPYQSCQPQQQQFQQFQQSAGSGTGPAYLSGAITTPGYSFPARPSQMGSSHPGTTLSRPLDASYYVLWRGLRAATLVMMIVDCILEGVIYITFLLSLTPSNILTDFLFVTPLFVVATPAIWWHCFGLRHLFHSQPVAEMPGLALWFDYGALIMSIADTSKDLYTSMQNVTIVLLPIVTAVDATLTARLNQHLKTPQPQPITLVIGACQFMLINSATHILYLTIPAHVSISAGKGPGNYTTSAWLIWSESEDTGLFVATGLFIFTVVTSLTVTGLHLGVRRPFSTSSRIVSTSAVSLLMFYNIIIVLAYGLSTVDRYAFQPSSTGVAMAIIINQGILLIGLALMAGYQSAVTPPGGRSQQQYGTTDAAGPHGVQNRLNRRHRSQSQWGIGYWSHHTTAGSTHDTTSVIDTDRQVKHDADMRQPLQLQNSSTPTPPGTDGHGPAAPYGVMPHGPYAPASSPHAAFTSSHGLQSGQQVDYPYLFQARTTPPTQSMAPHLSSIGQLASSIITNGADIDPYSAGPTANFPRPAPVPIPRSLPVTPQSSMAPVPVGAPPLGVTRTNPLPSPAPWR